MARPFIQTYAIASGSRRYRAWYFDGAGAKRSKVFPTKREAEAFLKEVTRREATGTLADETAGRVTFEAVWFDRRAREQFAAATLAVHDHVWRIVGPVLGHRPIKDITSGHVESALAGINGQAMREKARSVLVATFNHAIADHRIAVNPAKAARKSQTRAAKMAAKPKSAEHEPRLDSGQLTALIDATPQRYRTLVHLMARVGLRPGEAYALTPDQFNPEQRRLHIDRTISKERLTKTGEQRTLLLPRVIADELAGHIQRYANEKLVFPTREGSELTLGGFRTIFRRAVTRAGIPYPLSPNALRHTAAAFAVAHGANVYDVQKMLGHKRPSITLDVYGFLWEGSEERLAEALDVAIRAATAA